LFIASSEAIWEEEKRWNHYKAVPYELKELLEGQYTRARKDGARGVVTVPNSDLKVRGRGQEGWG
jgi:hypothetical protein